MKVVWWPRTDGDVILDGREVLRNGVLVPALVAVDNTGKVKQFGELIIFPDGGGHVETTRLLIAEDLGFERNVNGNMKMGPEGV